MKAALFREPHAPLTIEEVQIDNPRPREVLVRTAAVGVCHSDLHYIDGFYPRRHRPSSDMKLPGSSKRSDPTFIM